MVALVVLFLTCNTIQREPRLLNPMHIHIRQPARCQPSQGGLYSFLLSGNGTTYPKVDAAVAFHPSGITAADVDAVASPISLQSADPKLDNNVKDLYSYIEKARFRV